MDPEKRFIEVHEGIAVESLVFFLRAFLGLFEIERVRIVDGLIVLAFRIEIDLVRHKGTVFAQEIAHNIFLKEFLLFLCKVHDDLRAARLFVAVTDRICGVAVRLPMDACRIVLIRSCKDLDILGNHVRGVKSESEVSDDAVAARLFVFIDEVGGA